MKKLLILLFLSLFLISSCNIPQEIQGCTTEAKVCPDGSVVGRAGPNCEFEKCPNRNNFTIVNNYTIDANCNSDEDCIIIDKDWGLNCYYQGPCGSVDFSKDNYIAVNSKSYYDTGNLNCLSRQRQGYPGAACQVTIINDNYAAKCFDGICEKVEKEKPQVVTISGMVLYGEGDCMPPINEEARQYSKFNGKIYFIPQVSYPTDHEIIMPDPISTEVKDGQFSINLIPRKYNVVLSKLHENFPVQEIEIESNKVTSKDFKFFKCLSY